METTIEQRKEKAIEMLKQLNIYKPYIQEFVNKNEVCYFENFGGFWAWQDKQLHNKIKEIESKYNCTVYAITHEITEFGECYDFLIIPSDDEDWQDLVSKYSNNTYTAYAYVWNKDYDYCSEFGDILVQSLGGGLRRYM